jgi:hypothetical protein
LSDLLIQHAGLRVLAEHAQVGGEVVGARKIIKGANEDHRMSAMKYRG